MIIRLHVFSSECDVISYSWCQPIWFFMLWLKNLRKTNRCLHTNCIGIIRLYLQQCKGYSYAHKQVAKNLCRQRYDKQTQDGCQSLSAIRAQCICEHRKKQYMRYDSCWTSDYLILQANRKITDTSLYMYWKTYFTDLVIL